jgi:tyrosine-protein phosphatase non-receptor type 11
MSFFHHISRGEAEELLTRKGSEGSYLVRQSESNPSDYTLSVKLQRDVTHVRIQQKGEFYDLYGGEEFATISELIQYYMENPGNLKERNGREITLTKPLPSEDLANERYFHRNLQGRQAESLLMSKGTSGSYLMRASFHTPGSYVLSTRVTDDVIHIMIAKGNNQFYIEGGPKFDNLQELVAYYRINTIIEKGGREIYLIQPYCSTSFLPKYIGQHIQELAKPDDALFGKTGFEEEYQQIQNEGLQHLFTRKEASLPQNRPKNRFKNVLPFDHSRVVLQQSDPNENSYINANFIHGEIPNSSCAYIATQGCLPGTVHDFWTMVWQQWTPVIVMITNEVERGKNKCSRYWPNLGESGLYGKVRVTTLEESNFGTYALRYFLLDNVNGRESSRCIYQFQFLTWPDHGVPNDPSSLLKFMEDINLKQKEMRKDSPNYGPPTIHCSAGIGRTGTYIAIDILIKLIEYKGWESEIDIQQCVLKLRESRSGMVQTEDQYRFLYRALEHYIENRAIYANI